MQTLLHRHWHHLPSGEVLELLDSSEDRGLDTFEIHHRQKHFGPNLLTPPGKQSALLRFVQQFNNPLIYILLASALITTLLKDIKDGVIIFGVILLNAVIGYLQESRAEKAIEALAQALNTEASVMRAGQTRRISATELVPGDIILLKSGDKVPADVRLVRSRDLQIAEAALTGESLPIHKDASLLLAPETILAERRNMAFASTLVTSGQGLGVVIATGNATQVGHISDMIASATEMITPLTRQMRRFSQWVLYVILGLAALTFLVEVWRGSSIVETLTTSIALAVAMIPEGLPAALTVTLAIGVARMAQRQAIIRKLPAVETLGSVTVICSDKTGTLTQNQMTTRHIQIGHASYEVQGSGYLPQGEILFDKQPIDPGTHPGLLECLRAGLLCNDSTLVKHNGQWEAEGDPTEIALVVAAHKGQLDPNTVRQQWPRLDEIPFDSQYQYMATLHDTGEGRVVYVKGAVETLLERCTHAQDHHGQVSALDSPAIHRQVEELATEGLRVLAFARLDLPTSTSQLSHAHIASDLTFLGLQGMIDPPRPEAISAVQACRKAGIQIKMITGDHALTATAIAHQLGITDTAGQNKRIPPVLTGREMSELSDEALMEAAAQHAVFARVSPEQKLRLVEALQERGQVVAMTGDGVNDGPALKQADIGIAMGITGTDVAKEAADMVLTNDNFATIEAAVEEGRGVFDNLTKIIVWTLPTNIGQGLIILAALFFGVPLPILPIQILWINLTSTGALGLTLALEPKEPDIMSRQPRNARAPILTPPLITRILLVGAFILTAAFGLFEWELHNGATLEQARTVAVNVVSMIGTFYLFNCRSLTLPVQRVGFFSNRWILLGLSGIMILQILFTYVPVFNAFMYSAPISLPAWGRILLVGLTSYGLIELEKWMRRRRPGKTA